MDRRQIAKKLIQIGRKDLAKEVLALTVDTKNNIFMKCVVAEPGEIINPDVKCIPGKKVQYKIKILVNYSDDFMDVEGLCYGNKMAIRKDRKGYFVDHILSGLGGVQGSKSFKTTKKAKLYIDALENLFNISDAGQVNPKAGIDRTIGARNLKSYAAYLIAENGDLDFDSWIKIKE